MTVKTIESIPSILHYYQKTLRAWIRRIIDGLLLCLNNGFKIFPNVLAPIMNKLKHFFILRKGIFIIWIKTSFCVIFKIITTTKPCCFFCYVFCSSDNGSGKKQLTFITLLNCIKAFFFSTSVSCLKQIRTFQKIEFKDTISKWIYKYNLKMNL